MAMEANLYISSLYDLGKSIVQRELTAFENRVKKWALINKNNRKIFLTPPYPLQSIDYLLSDQKRDVVVVSWTRFILPI
jgi:hypothetical protein